MNKEIVCFCISAVLATLVSAGGGFAQNIPSPGEPSCVGVYDHNGQYHAKGSQYYYVVGGKTYKCIACSDDCTPVDAKTGSAGSTDMSLFPVGGAGSSEQFAQQMMVNMLGSLIEQALAPPPDNSASLQQQAALEKAKKEAEQRERLARWQQMEQARANRQHQESDQLRSMLEVGPLEAGSGGGAFDVADWGGSEDEFQARDAGMFDTSGFSMLKRLACANDFAQRAQGASENGDYAKARYLNEQAENVMAGRKTELECRWDDLPNVPKTPDGPAPVDMAAYETIINRVQQDVEQLQGVKLRLREIEEKKEVARQQIEKIREDMAIQNKPADADKKTPNPLEDDQLELEAQKLLEEAQNELAAMEKDEQDLVGQQSELESGLKAVQEQLQAAGTGR